MCAGRRRAAACMEVTIRRRSIHLEASDPDTPPAVDVPFFFEENGKRFAVIFIRRRKKLIKIYKHTFNSTTQLNTTENFKENKKLLVNTSKTAKQRNHITTRRWMCLCCQAS